MLESITSIIISLLSQVLSVVKGIVNPTGYGDLILLAAAMTGMYYLDKKTTYGWLVSGIILFLLLLSL